jgi:hypothetical protein
MQLIVLGMQNSATTVVTRILNMMGAHYGPEDIRISETLGSPVENWGNKDLRELSDNVLSAVDARWDRIADFDIQRLPGVDRDRFMKKATNLVLELDANRPWVINEPRMCLLFPLLRPLLEIPICILVNRSPAQIAHEFRDCHGFPINFSIALWEKYTLSSVSVSAGLPRIFVSFEEIIKDPIGTIEQLYTHLCECDVQKLRLPHEREIQAFIQKKINRSEEPDHLDRSFFNSCQKRLIEIIETKKFDQLDPPPSLSLEAIETMFQFEDKVKVETDFKKKSVEFTEQRESLDAKERETKSFKSKLKEKDAFIQANDREMTEVKKGLETARKEIVILKEENKSLKSKLEEQYVTLAEKARDIEELKKQNTKLQENICGLDDSLKAMKDELERYRSDFYQVKQELGACQSEMARIKAEASACEDELKIKNNELQSFRERKDTTLQKADLMQKEILKYKEIQRDADTTVRSQKNYLKTLENSLNHQKHFVYKLTHWLGTLDSDFNALRKSKRWTIGNSVVRMIEIVLLRKKVPIAMDHIGGILKEFQDWRARDLKKKPVLRNPNQ